VTDSPGDPPVLTAAETRAAEALLSDSCGETVAVRTAEKIWDRHHIVRLRLADGRSVVLKRARAEDFGIGARSFSAELANLEFLNRMEAAVAPRLLGADASAGVLVMEDLGPGSSLADALLGTDRDRAQADLVSYARAVGTMHAWSAGRDDEYAEIRARHAGTAELSMGPHWLDAITRGKEPFLAVSAQLGLPTSGVGAEIDSLAALMAGAGYVGLVHSDLCPDNTHISDGSCRLIDFETSGWGPAALDVAYLLAPFPSCWCFARLPSAVAAPALRAYRDQVKSAGIDLGADWDTALAAALAGSVVARGRGIAGALDNDDERWGTTTMRPRLLTWLSSFTQAAAATGALPRLRSVAEALQEELGRRWPRASIPDYPALARPGATLARLSGGEEA
jgi:Ser/Thr protein kinase RdoA (MazF antagonist)